MLKIEKKPIYNKKESGQTLIETLVAISVLIVALVSGLALAIFTLSHTQINRNQIIAANLAREGVETIRMMRDSNWLAYGRTTDSWAELQPCSGPPNPDYGGRLCYPKAFEEGDEFTSVGLMYHYDLEALGNWSLFFESALNSWNMPPHLDDQPASMVGNWDLYVQPDGMYTSTPNGTSTFARMINLSYNSAYDAYNSEMIVKSVVAWRGKGCPDFDGTKDLLREVVTPCKTIVEERLTNWKDYK